jgi:SAM-dependent methyltransferase
MTGSWITDARRPQWDKIVQHAEQHQEEGTRDGQFSNMVYPLLAFGDLLNAVDLYDEEYGSDVACKLLDIGCGAGQLMAIATEFFSFRSDGFDNSAYLAEQADELTWQLMPEGMYMSAWQEDVTDFNFNLLDMYHVVVLNRLFVGPGQQTDLETKVFDYLSPGSYMIKLNNVSMPEDATIITSNSLGGCVVRKS